MSMNHQGVQQLVTPASQNRCIGPTQVNICDNDEQLVTNKQGLDKQHSNQMGNHSTWLSNTFSKFTSNVFGQAEGEYVQTDNINVCLNSKVEFSFFL